MRFWWKPFFIYPSSPGVMGRVNPPSSDPSNAVVRRVGFVVGHPAHVHLFKNAIRDLNGLGYRILILAVRKEITLEVLRREGFSYEVIGTNYPSLLAKAVTIPGKDWRTVQILRDFDPDLVVSTGSPYAAHACRLLGIPHICFGDTEVASLATLTMLPFIDAIYTPDCFSIDLGQKQIRYPSYHELAYLHPRRFRPDPEALLQAGLRAGEPYFILRLSSADSAHDMREEASGVTNRDLLLHLLTELEKHGRPIVSSEVPLPSSITSYLGRFPPEIIHSLLAFATLYVGEGATMASEAGILGTPWVFISRTPRGYLDDQERVFGLGTRVESLSAAVPIALRWASEPMTKESWKEKSQRLIAVKADTTEIIVDAVRSRVEGGAAR